MQTDIQNELQQRRQAEQALEKREKYLSTIVQIQAALLSSDEEEMINQAVLGQLGEISHASQIYYYQDQQDERGIHKAIQKMKWQEHDLASGSTELFPNVLDYDSIPAWIEKLKRGGIVSGKVSEIIPDLPKEIKSLVLIPVMVTGKYVGFIGFENYTSEQSWDEMEIGLLQVATSSLGLAKEHQLAVNALLQSQAEQLLMLDQLPALLIHFDQNSEITSIRGSWLKSLDVDEEKAKKDVRRYLLWDENIKGAIKTGLNGIRVSFETHWDAITLQIYLEPLKDETSKISGVIALALDISERKHSEDILRRSEESIRSLYTIASSQELTYSEKIRSLLMMGCRHFNAETGLITEVQDTVGIVLNSYTRGMKIHPGMTFELHETLDEEILKTNNPIFFANAQTSSWRTHPIHQRLKVDSFIGVRIGTGKKIVKTISFFSSIPRINEYSPSDIEFLRLMAQWVGTEYEREEYVTKIKEYAEEISRNSLALTEARDQALEAARVKSEFLATMSHEIRTPLNAMIGMTELLLGSSLTDEQKEYTVVARDSAKMLLLLISDILDFSKIEARKVNLESITFDPTQVVEEAVELFSAKAHEKGISLMSYVSSEIPHFLEGDPIRLKQVLINLISNALKFTSQGEVTVRVEMEEKDHKTVVLRFLVKDTGIGIEPTTQHLLFQPFSQADGSTTRKYGGTGLGLAISKRLVELMGGNIGFTSKPGKGSTFYFSVRFNKVKLDIAEGSRMRMRKLNDLRILVVDDNQTHREILGKYLKSWQMNATLIEKGKTALEVFDKQESEKKPFQLAILDMQLPDINGFDLAAELIKRTKGKNFHLVLLTAFDHRRLSREAIQAGFSAFLTKPVKKSLLFDTIANLVKPITLTKMKTKSLKIIEVDIGGTSQQEKENVRILLAEDNPANQMLADIQLKKLGYQVDAVVNGKAALEAFQKDQKRYQLILMDCQMPDMDGFDATLQIRKLEKEIGGHIPIIAMTANAMEGDRHGCIEAGMDDYLSKPVNMKTLAETIDHWTKRKIKDKITQPHVKENKKMKIILDSIILNNIRELQTEGEDDLLNKLIDVYTQDSKKTMKLIKEAVEKSDYVATCKAVHNLKGSSANLGGADLAGFCKKMELAAENKNMDLLHDLLPELEEIYNETVKALGRERIAN